jgi:hypothetical protein
MRVCTYIQAHSLNSYIRTPLFIFQFDSDIIVLFFFIHIHTSFHVTYSKRRQNMTLLLKKKKKIHFHLTMNGVMERKRRRIKRIVRATRHPLSLLYWSCHYSKAMHRSRQNYVCIRIRLFVYVHMCAFRFFV